MLRIRTETTLDITVLHCAGRIVIGEETVSLRDAIASLATSRIIILDLAEVHRIDAAGLGALLAARQWTLARTKSLKLMNVTRDVERLLRLTHLYTVFEICSVGEMLELVYFLGSAPASLPLTYQWASLG